MMGSIKLPDYIHTSFQFSIFFFRVDQLMLLYILMFLDILEIKQRLLKVVL